MVRITACLFIAYISLCPTQGLCPAQGSCAVQNNPVVRIVVHGTFASNEDWCGVGGDFVRALRSGLKNLPSMGAQQNAPIVAFRWSGHNNAHARVVAARELGNLVLSYPSNQPIEVIGHSHAGNVIAVMSKLLRNPFVLDDETTGTESIQDGSGVMVRSISAQKEDWASVVGLPCDERALREIERAQAHFYAFYQQKALESITRSCGIEGYSHAPALEQRKIQCAYLLGTPVDAAVYMCDMSVVERCYALHSTADMVQTVGGFYGRLFPKCKRLLNLKVVLVTKSGKVLGMGHSQLHSPTIGQWLLALPHIIENEEGMAADAFDGHEKLVAVFFDDGRRPMILSALRDEKGKMHSQLQACINDLKTKTPTAFNVVGELNAQFGFDYSLSGSP